MTTRQHTRREFLALTGVAASGLMLSACIPTPEVTLHNGEGYRPNLFMAIDREGTVTIIAARSEMGQGVRSSLPQILADELDADWDKVEVVQAIGDKRYGNQDTDGSRSIRNHFQRMREFGATGRYLLLVAAAQQLSVPIAELSTEPGKVLHAKSGRAIGYGALVDTASKLELPFDYQPTLKSPDQFRYIGRSIPHVDLQAICDGSAQYGFDIQLPGMLYAVIERCPVVGGRIADVDDKAARKVPGVVDVVEIQGRRGPPGFNPQAGVAVLANNTWSAQRGRAALAVEWDLGDNAGDNSEQYIDSLRATTRQPGKTVRNQGDVDAAFNQAAQVVEAEYIVPYLAHATMEPVVATAWYRDDTCEVWAPTQNPQGARQQVASTLDLDENAVIIHVTLLGGGFGRKSKPDFINEAALLSEAMEAPVKVCWSREDDIQHDYYHAASAQYLKAGLDSEGKTQAWLHRSIYPAIGTTFSKEADNLGELSLGCVDMPYDIPNIRIEGGAPAAHVRIGWLRSVGNIQHAFAVNSFAAELALAAGRDPAEYLLELIGPPRDVDLGADTRFSNHGMPMDRYPVDTARLRYVTEVALQEAGWQDPLPAGHGRGIAVHRSFLSYVASVVEVAKDKDGKIRVLRVTSAADVGRIINPERLRSQMEGGAIFGLSLAMFGEISTRNGAIEQSNFHDYPVLRMPQSPSIDIHLVESDAVPTGAGEPPTPPLSAALCNAVHNATGKRIRRLPLARHGLV